MAIVVVAVVEAAVGSVELQRERERDCQQRSASERLTAKTERSNSYLAIIMLWLAVINLAKELTYIQDL